MSIVLDSSVTLAWIFATETTPAIRVVFDSILEGGAWVPGLWRLEVANVLEMAIRRGRCDRAFRHATLTDLSLLPIRLDPETDVHAWESTSELVGRHRLTVYDAAYLEVAKRRSLPLATLDAELQAAATAENVQLLGR